MKNKRIWNNFKSYKFNSLLVRNFVLIFLIIIIPILTITYTVQSKYNEAVVQEIETANYNSLLRVKETIDRAMQEATRLATHLSITTNYELYFSPTEEFVNYYNVFDDIRKRTKEYLSIYDYIESVYFSSLYFKDLNNSINQTITEIGLENTTISDKSWYSKDVIDSTRINRYIGWQENRINKPLSNYISVVHYVRKARRLYAGSVTVNLRSTYLANMIDVKEDQGEIAMVVDNKSDKVIIGNNGKNFLEPVSETDIISQIEYKGFNGSEINTIDGNKYIVSAVNSDYMEWTYLSVLPLTSYSNNVDNIMTYVNRRIIIYLIISLILSYFLTIKTYEPIGVIMKIIENPSLWKTYSEKRKGEVNFISENILKIVLSNDLLEKELRQNIKLLDKAQNKALQSQMNPHFLYNTLETINFETMEIANGQNNASDMISDLSELLRYSLDGEQYSTIEAEISSVNHYVKIMEKRYAGKLKVIWEIDEKLLSNTIMKLTIQPLIENAIYHGIKPKRGEGYIWISVYEKEENIIIEIQDDGLGIEKGKLSELNKEINDKYLLKKEGIGLYNVNQRIKILYGESYGVEIDSTLGKGTITKINIPLEL